jgi:Ran GTPase-activating protein (RanGAP) involved in mRNA processing and transport
MKDNTTFEALNLSHNDIGNSGAKDVASLISGNDYIKTLNLSNNKISGLGLNNIRHNNIATSSLKTLLAMLYRNDTITSIYYTCNTVLSASAPLH